MEGKGQARARRKGQGRVLSYGVRAEGTGERTRNTAGAWREGRRDEGRGSGGGTRQRGARQLKSEHNSGDRAAQGDRAGQGAIGRIAGQGAIGRGRTIGRGR